MKPVTTHTGVAVPFDRADVDTDLIIPARFLKRIERTGYGEFLFQSLRYLPDGSPNPEFVLNRPAYRDGTVLVAGRNFGCGSSREHAAWALEDAGYRVVLAPSFGDIFRTNATKTGMAPIVVAQDDLDRIKAALAERNELTVDLEALEIRHPDGLTVPFMFDEFARHNLLEGLDDIGLTLQREDRIGAYEAAHAPRVDTLLLA